MVVQVVTEAMVVAAVAAAQVVGRIVLSSGFVARVALAAAVAAVAAVPMGARVGPVGRPAEPPSVRS